MDKIVDGIVFRGKYLPDAWEVRTFKKNGVMERSVRQVMEWEEVGFSQTGFRFQPGFCASPS
jgi:hypothetical protein